MARNTGAAVAEIRQQIAAAQPLEGGLEVSELARRWLDGESPQVLAKVCRTTRRTIVRRIKRWMLAGRGDEAYFELVTEALVNRIADADEKLEEARDPVQIAKYREMARFARMDFERRRPALYGQKQEVKHTGGVPQFTVVLLDRPSGGGALVGGSHARALAVPAVVGEKQGEGDEGEAREGAD